MASLIEIENLSFAYSASGNESNLTLHSINLTIEDGEYVALIGKNGSGKTTLARHMNGLLIPTTGSVRVAGLDTRNQANLSKIRSMVGMVFQYPEDQIIATTIEEDVAFGPENLGLPSGEIRNRVADALHQVGMWEERSRPPHSLSAGQMQRVAVAGVLAFHPRCIIFDEATAMLDPTGRKAALSILKRLNAEGLAIITITHSMAEAALAQRVIVLQHGQVAMDWSPARVFADEQPLKELGLELPPAAALARTLGCWLPGLPGTVLTSQNLLDALPAYSGLKHETGIEIQPPSPPARENPIIAVEGLGHIYRLGTPLAQRALIQTDLNVMQSESYGLIGATGSGKSTLLQHLNGLLLPQEGKVRVAEYSLNDPKVDLIQVRRTAGLVMQIPETQFFEQYVLDEIAFGPRTLGRVDTLKEDILSAMAMVGLDYETFKDRLTFTLSGGERRKLALASILAIHPEILLLDEPFLGLDPEAHHDLLAKFKNMQTGGRTLVFSSHLMEDMAELSESLTVMHAGRTVLNGPTGAVFSQDAMLREYGLEPPLVTQIAETLRSRGWPVPPGILREPLLVDALTAVTAHE